MFVVLWGYKSSCCEGFGGGEGVVHSQMNVPRAVGTLACAVEDMVFAGFLGEIPLVYFIDAFHCEGIENRVVSKMETAGYVSAGHRGTEPRSQGCCRMCIAMCGAINPDFSNAGFNMWLSLFAGRPAAAAVGLPLYGMIPGGSYLKTLNPYDRKNMMTFLVFRRELWQVRESNPLHSVKGDGRSPVSIILACPASS